MERKAPYLGLLRSIFTLNRHKILIETETEIKMRHFKSPQGLLIISWA